MLSERKAVKEEAKILEKKQLSMYFLVNPSSVNAEPTTCTKENLVIFIIL